MSKRTKTALTLLGLLVAAFVLVRVFGRVSLGTGNVRKGRFTGFEKQCPEPLVLTFEGDCVTEAEFNRRERALLL